MAKPKFTIGQVVDYETPTAPAPRPSGPFEVTRVLPTDDGKSQAYRIKSKSEPFERSVKEYEITAVVRPPSECAAVFG